MSLVGLQSKLFVQPNCVRVLLRTYLLNDDNFNGSCCFMLAAETFGELVALTKLTGVGLTADGTKKKNQMMDRDEAGEIYLALASIDLFG